MKLTHVRLLVDDFDACFRFYRDVLGLTPTWGAEGEGYADFDAGPANVALFARTGQVEAVELRVPGDGALVVLAVDDVAAEVARLGDEILAGPLDRAEWGIRVAYLRDPAGTLIELNEPIGMEAS